ncbi:hypothetical protein GCM10015535_18640 [Streptomyces gelaticus]|uniref:HTH marR-type domain-containing protein n=1 Tax=Streptomyces gelaticus TaxID=285446 RepID=A0ABQ2VYL5_9ACTN|nr:hypothetical protein GCM10015535_18640 [Streptomyces gelaticus]
MKDSNSWLLQLLTRCAIQLKFEIRETEGGTVPGTPEEREASLDVIQRELTAFARRARAVAARLHPELPLVSYTLLAHIEDRHGCRATDLAAHYMLDKSTVSQQISTLEKLGLVERHPAPGDHRIQVLHPTAAGTQAARLHTGQPPHGLPGTPRGLDGRRSRPVRGVTTALQLGERHHPARPTDTEDLIRPTAPRGLTALETPHAPHAPQAPQPRTTCSTRIADTTHKPQETTRAPNHTFHVKQKSGISSGTRTPNQNPESWESDFGAGNEEAPQAVGLWGFSLVREGGFEPPRP